MCLSKYIPINIEDVAEAILDRQDAAWNGGLFYDRKRYEVLDKFFCFINMHNVPKEEFFYHGDIFRIHCPSTTHISMVDVRKEFISGKLNCDGSCSVLPYTVYNNSLSSFSKCCDFTKNCYYKISPHNKAVLLHFNTKNMYGIDVNAFLYRYGYDNRFEYEQEVLFPMCKDYLVREYRCTPKQFLYYMRSNEPC